VKLTAAELLQVRMPLVAPFETFFGVQHDRDVLLRLELDGRSGWRGVPVWCGGMVETGLGRAANMALAALPGFTLPGDISASDRFYRRDIVTEPFVPDDGHIAVPTGPGLGVEVDEDALAAVTVHRKTVPLPG